MLSPARSRFSRGGEKNPSMATALAATHLLQNPSHRLPLIRNPNPNFLLSFSSVRRFCPPRLGIRCSSEVVNGAYPRPTTITWRKDIANSVQFIGIVGTPVQIKYVSSGKVLAWTRLGVKNSSTETTW